MLRGGCLLVPCPENRLGCTLVPANSLHRHTAVELSTAEVALASWSNAAMGAPQRMRRAGHTWALFAFMLRASQVLTWSVLAINAVFVWLALALLSLRQTGEWTVGQVSSSVAIMRCIMPAGWMSLAISIKRVTQRTCCAGCWAAFVHCASRLLSGLQPACWRACQRRPPDPCAACDASCAAAAASILQSGDDHWWGSHGSPVSRRRLVWYERLDQRARRAGLVSALLAAAVTLFAFYSLHGSLVAGPL